MKTTTLRSLAAPVFAGLLALGFHPEAQAKVPPGTIPAFVSGLSHFDLEIPVANGSGVWTITTLTSSPSTGFTSNPGYQDYFYSYAGGNYMDFIVPPNGATTSGSTHPRTELKQKSTERWVVSSATHTLTGTCKVTQFPKVTVKGQMTLAQVHDNVSSNGPLLRLICDYNGAPYLYTEHRLNPTKSSTIYKTGPHYSLPLNTQFDYEIKLTSAHVLTVKVRPNSASAWVTICDSSANGPLSTAWGSETCYFKAGCYMQDESSAATPVASVRYYALAVQ